MSKSFEWDDSALIPDSVEVNMPTKDPKAKEKITFYELPRIELIAFIKEGVDTKFVKEPEKEGDLPKAVEFAIVEETQLKVMCKYLAKSCRGAKDEDYFISLDWHPGMIKAFASLLTELNHLEEIMVSGGNWLALPAVSEALSAANKTAVEESESQKPTLQA